MKKKNKYKQHTKQTHDATEHMVIIETSRTSYTANSIVADGAPGEYKVKL